jgi:chorismate mutase
MGGNIGIQTPKRRSWVGRLGFLLSVVTLAVFACLGLAALLIEGQAWWEGQRWKPIDIVEVKKLFERLRGSKSLFDLLGLLIQYGTYLSALLVALMALLKVDKIAKLIKDFNAGNTKGTILGLVRSASEIDEGVKRLEPAIVMVSSMVPRLETASSNVSAATSALQQKLEEIVTQIGELKKAEKDNRENDSRRERIVELWAAHKDRIERTIRSITDKGLREHIDGLSRRSYPKILDALAEHGLIDDLVRNKSKSLHETFRKYRLKTSIIPESVVQDSDYLDHMFAGVFGDGATADEGTTPAAASE